MRHGTHDIECFLDKPLNRPEPIRGEGFADAVGHNDIQAKALMPEHPAQSVYSRCFHFEITHAKGTEAETCQSFDQVRLTEAQP